MSEMPRYALHALYVTGTGTAMNGTGLVFAVYIEEKRKERPINQSQSINKLLLNPSIVVNLITVSFITFMLIYLYVPMRCMLIS